MQILKATFLGISLFLITSCTDNVPDKDQFENIPAEVRPVDTTKHSTITESTPEQKPEVPVDQFTAEHTVLGLLKWYRLHGESVAGIPIVTGIVENGNTLFVIDFKSVKLYIKTIKACGFFSDDFITGLQQYFEKADKQLKHHPQHTGTPAGFDVDLIMRTDNYMDGLDSLNTIHINAIAGNQSIKTVEADFNGLFKLRYYLSYKGDKWYIDAIENATNPR